MSAKLRAANADTGGECKMDLSPMIDMVFLLLIFFLVNASLIVVKIDKDVQPAKASMSDPAKDGTGRIVINVREDGTYTDVDGKVLSGEEEIRAYVLAERLKVDQKGKTPRLHVRGDHRAAFAAVRKAVKAASREQVNQVIFSTYLK